MNFNFKGFATNASTQFNRAVQFTQENLGNAQKTELDVHLENLIGRGTVSKEWTEKILAGTQAVVQPNPKVRMEEYVFDKFDRKKRELVTNEEDLGQNMLAASNDFGPGTPYGLALAKCGKYFMKIGQFHKQYSNVSSSKFMLPLHNFLEGDIKTVQKEKRELELKRLDLDSCKNKLRKVKTQHGEGNAMKELDRAQIDFDRQAEITKLLLEGIVNAQGHHHRCLVDYVESMREYFDQCRECTVALQEELRRSPGGGGLNHFSIAESPTSEVPPTSRSRVPNYPIPDNAKRARVLYDYDAANNSEISLLADEVIQVFEVPDLDSNWLICVRESQQGMVPVTHVELL